MGTGIARDMYSGYPDTQDEFNETLIKIWWQLYRGIGSGQGGGVIVPATAAKTLVNTSSNGSIPAGFLSAILQVGSGATVVIDGMTLVAGQTITYPPGAKLHAEVDFTISGGSLIGFYEV